jgi:hypothetical protein
MKPRTVFFTLLILAGMLSLPAFAGARPATGLGCGPNGNQFDLEPLVNSPFDGQSWESVGFIPGRGLDGADLVVGAAWDVRILNPVLIYDGFPLPAYYVQRDNSNCVADFEGGAPVLKTDYPATSGPPRVAADPAHDAFFMTFPVIQASDAYAITILKSTSANLLNGTNCPNGTQGSSDLTCWPVQVDANSLPLNDAYLLPAIAVDQRTQGTGAGDVYVAAEIYQPYQIALMACTNSTLNCSSTVVVSAKDKLPTDPWVQVRPDGGITISYATFKFEFATREEMDEIKFVNCTPQGAPKPPTCSAPTVVTKATLAGIPYPWHVDRLEADGKTVTNFLVYDGCAVETFHSRALGTLCSKQQTVIGSSTDGGNTWSSFQPISPGATGQQFLGDIALDASTGTVNVAYFSTQNDPLQFRTQLFLAQIPPGQTTVGSINQITSTLFNGPASYYYGIAAAGTGTKGQSHVYIHYVGTTNNGSYNGQAFPVYANTLTQFDY